MEDEETARTLELRIAEDIELAQTLVKRPRDTIEPHRHASLGAVGALDALKKMGGVGGDKIALHRTIGEGGMGIVHLATQATMGRHVAVKTLRDGAGHVDATLRMLREAWVTGALEHPNIVPVYDVGVDASGAPIIVMKRVEGRPWNDVIHAPEELLRLTGASDALDANIRILMSVCNAIHFAHSRGILHRDIKPENVMIGAFGEVYVLDWGIAVSMREDPSGRLPPVSQANEVAGTPSYMAPEMILGQAEALSPRTDVYLLGAVFYELFAGAPPHDGPSLHAIVSSILLSSPKFGEAFPAEARGICEKAMARAPGDRYASVEELRAAIEGYLQHRGSRKIAHEAKQSLAALLRTLKEEPAGEERTLAVFNLLGECRFGYRAALSAWAGNVAARRGLDRALIAVVEHELTEGEPNAALALLREVAEVPEGLAARVDAAVKKRAEEDERLRKLGQDLDPTVGSRTRMFIGIIFGALWTATPIVAWVRSLQGHELSHVAIVGASVVFLALGVGLRAWARESLTKTLLNRRLSWTLGLQLGAQMLLGAGAWLGGLTPMRSMTLHVLTWALTEALMAVWVERWVGLSAAACAVTFVVGSARPELLYPLAAASNLIFTLVLAFVWFPRQDIAVIQQRREALRGRARRLFLDMRRPEATGDDEGA